MDEVRSIYIKRLAEDLVGPKEVDEEFDDWPTDRYLTGILYPTHEIYDLDQEDLFTEIRKEEDEDSRDQVKAWAGFKPSTAGLSFAVSTGNDSPIALTAKVNATIYVPEAQKSKGEEKIDKHSGSTKKIKPDKILWKRKPLSAEVDLKFNGSDYDIIDLKDHGIPNMNLFARVQEHDGDYLITLTISNAFNIDEKSKRLLKESSTFFQSSINVKCTNGTIFIPKRESQRDGIEDDEILANKLLYRNTRQYAVGHTCSADWSVEDEKVSEVFTTWLPKSIVRNVDPEGDPVFSKLLQEGENGPFAVSSLAQLDKRTILSKLSEFINCYNTWIESREKEISTLPSDLQGQGGSHLRVCRKAKSRMQDAIEILDKNDNAFIAFQLANLAISTQYLWKKEAGCDPMNWRPFQLGFILLCLSSIANPKDPYRETMDLLWFPTGGGKTEAYLFLIAFLIFLRRLQCETEEGGAGVTCFMRYTLRLLTIQQFERASALICVCELIRQGIIKSEFNLPEKLLASKFPISIGLWVGESVTPNDLKTAETQLNTVPDIFPRQLLNCPKCRNILNYSYCKDLKRIEIRCCSEDCILGTNCSILPIWMVDEDIYRERPSLIIATVDKYAQIVRKKETGLLFGIGTNSPPPELIIQDELHLISGPLGSLVGLYEIAIDEMCKSNEVYEPKLLVRPQLFVDLQFRLMVFLIVKDFNFHLRV